MSMIFVPLITCCALALYAAVSINVARARIRHQIKPPAISGPPEFERRFRVQQNTLEQLMFFLPSLWMFGAFVSDKWGAIIGSVWVVARIFYALGYYQDAPKRMPGFFAGQAASVTLFIGAVAGIVSTL